MFSVALSSMALCYRNILTKMRRLRSDFVKNCEGFMKCGVWNVECGVVGNPPKENSPGKPKLFVFERIPVSLSCERGQMEIFPDFPLSFLRAAGNSSGFYFSFENFRGQGGLL